MVENGSKDKRNVKRKKSVSTIIVERNQHNNCPNGLSNVTAVAIIKAIHVQKGFHTEFILLYILKFNIVTKVYHS